MPEAKKPEPTPVFTREELVIINNALNELCNGLHISEDEFHTRIGHTRAKAQKVLAKVTKALEA
jgi:hypothetical protein